MPNASVEQLNYPGDQDREQSADEFWSDHDSDHNNLVAQNGSNGSRTLKRKRPLTVSYVYLLPRYSHTGHKSDKVTRCELCKQRKVKCGMFCSLIFGIYLTDRVDRAQPSCRWCTRNGQLCEYKERKKPGLRAGYGKELEQRLGMYQS